MKTGPNINSVARTLAASFARALAASFVVMLVCQLAFAAVTRPFSDISEGDENFVAINYLQTKGLIEGYDDNTFRPLNEVNRAEAIKMIMTALPGPETKNKEAFDFSDVKETDWFYPFLIQAWNNYLISGYSDGLLHPERVINRAESLKIALRQEGRPIPVSIDKMPYSDVDIGSWYAPYAKIADDRRLFFKSRSSGSLFPDKNMNRGSFAELLYRILKTENGAMFGRATWYADGLANTKTASGEPYAPDAFTVAHRTLPFGTKLLVTNLANNKSVQVIVNDRGPYSTGADLDLSKSAFAAIASTGAGIINTEYKIIDGNTALNDVPAYGF